MPGIGSRSTTVLRTAVPRAVRSYRSLAKPTAAKQIWIVGNRLPLISVGSVAQHFFILSQAQAINAGGQWWR